MNDKRSSFGESNHIFHLTDRNKPNQCFDTLLYRVVEIEDILAIGLHALVFFLRTNDDAVPCTKTCTSRYQMSADNILLHTLKEVNLTLDGSLIKNLCGLLERSGRHEALGLQCCTGNTLQNLS